MGNIHSLINKHSGRPWHSRPPPDFTTIPTNQFNVMFDKEKFLGTLLSDIRLVCAKAIRKAVADEHFEDAAAVRNARDKLERAITKTINNICPF